MVAVTTCCYSRLAKHVKDDKVLAEVKAAIGRAKQLMPMLEHLANTAMRERHWQAVLAALNADAPQV